MGPGFESQRDHRSSPNGLLFVFLGMASLYIFFSGKLNKYYVGACNDLDRRLYEHNLGHSKFTSTGLPWVLVYQESYPDLQTAKQRESQIKKMKSRKYIEGLISSAGSASRF